MEQTTSSADHGAPLTRGLKAIVFTVVSLCVGGCVSTHRALTLRSPLEATRDAVSISPSEAKDRFDRWRKDWTRQVEVFDHFEGRLFVTATMITPELERTRTLHHRSTLSLSEREYKSLLRGRLERLNKTYRFFVCLSSNDLPKLRSPTDTKKRAVMVDGAEDMFSAHLIIDGVATPPKQIDRLSFKRAQAIADDFPYISPVKTGYWIVFEVPERFRYHRLEATTHHFTLRFSGLSATASLKWATAP